MPPEKICKTVKQYNKYPVPPEDMAKLQEIAEDYRRVKNYVYRRYGGIGSLGKIYPGYTVQNEMTGSGLRAELGLPSVYFYLAIYEALGDIKSQWTRTKSKILQLVGRNEMFTPEEKHYLRFLVKSPNAFAAVLNREEICLPRELQAKLEELAGTVEAEHLHSYLCRQVRKYHVRQLHAEQAAGFSVTERAYRYGDHGIYLSTKQSRKRIFVPLTDNNSYENTIYISLYPERACIEVKVPMYMAANFHGDYVNEVGLAFGMFTMLTTDSGHEYGGKLGEYQRAYEEWLREKNGNYRRSGAGADCGRKKYHDGKRRHQEQLHSYINQELNRFLQTEKPCRVYGVKLPKPQGGGKNSRINYSAALWQRGYIRERLAQKCREHSVEYVEVLGRDIGRECSRCGEAGTKEDGIFVCGSCGYTVKEKKNTAENVLKRGREGMIVSLSGAGRNEKAGS